MKDEFDDWDPVAEREAAAAAPTPATKAPKMTAADRRAKREADARSTRSKIGAATRQRKAWEATPEGVNRRRDIVDLATEEHNRVARENPHLNMRQTGRLNVTRGQVYAHLGVTNDGHGYGDQQLPGFESPNAAPEPPRWEDLSPQHQQKVHENLRLHGTSIHQMSEDFGAQMDQAVWRAHQAGHRRASTGEPVPFTAHFYGEHPADAPEPLDRPKEMMRESRRHLASLDDQPGGQIAADNHTDPQVHTAVVGHVSPNVKFTQGERGARTSPNIEAAEAVFQQHAEGVPSRLMTSGKNRRGITNQSRPANSRRAGRMLEHIAGGGALADARNEPSASNPLGSTQWGPKTGPFANSFDAQHPDFLVSDVHTAGGGMFPHLGTEKPVRKTDEGGLARHSAFKGDPRSDKELMSQEGRRAFQPDKSGREKAIERSGSSLPGSGGKKVTFHSAADYAARKAVEARGLGSSVRRPQAAQWGEEQLQRGVASPKLDVPHHEEAYPSQKPPVNPNQMSLFG